MVALFLPYAIEDHRINSGIRNSLDLRGQGLEDRSQRPCARIL